MGKVSAFIVSHKHINTIISYGNGHPWATIVRMNDETVLHLDDPDDCQRAAEILLAENVRSINARYPDTITNPQGAPGLVDELGMAIVFKREHCREAVQIIKACDCYDYQACETDDYRNTDAAHIVATIQSRAIANLPGYEAAPWEIA